MFAVEATLFSRTEKFSTSLELRKSKSHITSYNAKEEIFILKVDFKRKKIEKYSEQTSGP